MLWFFLCDIKLIVSRLREGFRLSGFFEVTRSSRDVQDVSRCSVTTVVSHLDQDSRLQLCFPDCCDPGSDDTSHR